MLERTGRERRVHRSGVPVTLTRGGLVMGRHSSAEHDVADTTPGGATQPRSSTRFWTRRRLVVLAAFLGSCAIAAFVIMAATQTGNRPSGNVAARPKPTVRASASSRPKPPVRASASSRPKPPVSAPGSSLAELPVNTALRGSAAIAWADAALAALGAPTTRANVQTMVDWFTNEGTPHDLNNPLNLQTPYGGSTVSTADGDPPADLIQAYPNPADFAAAFPIEMNSGSYPAIVAALKGGTGLEGSAASSEISSELSLYSGGGYSSIPETTYSR